MFSEWLIMRSGAPARPQRSRAAAASRWTPANSWSCSAMLFAPSPAVRLHRQPPIAAALSCPGDRRRPPLGLRQRLQRLQHDLAAVDDDRLTRDVTSLLRREKQGGVADVLDLAEPLHRNRGRHRLEIVLAHPLQTLRED